MDFEEITYSNGSKRYIRRDANLVDNPKDANVARTLEEWQKRGIDPTKYVSVRSKA